MAEFIWKDKIKVVTREWTRGELMEFWGMLVPGGRFRPMMEADGIAAIPGDEQAMEYLAATCTAAVYIQNGKGWKEVTQPVDVEGIHLETPVQPEHFAAMPMSLVDHWIEAAIKENGTLAALLNFTSRRVLATTGTTGSETPSENTPSPES